jgi:cellulase/cellobiase CelA1
VRWTFANRQRIYSLWNGVLTQSGSAVMVANASYNGNLPLNGSTSFGFIANWNGSNAVPTDITCG